MEAWVKMDSINNLYETFHLEDRSQSELHSRAYSIARIRNDGSGASWAGRFYSTIVTSAGRTEVTSNVMAQANQWYHVVGTYDGAEHRLYVNGTLEATEAYSGSIVNNDR